MNYNKVIKDLKERNDKLQEQYRLRDIRCIHLEYENEMLKSDFKAQHELTKKYAEESKELNQKYLNAVADYETTMSELQELKKENKILRKNAENNDKVVDKVNWENQLLKKQIKTLDKTNIQLISKLDRYDAIVDERDELKKQLTTYQILHRDCKVDNLKNISKIEEMENQQKEFVKCLEDKLRIANEVLDEPEEDEDTRGYVLARKFMLEEILSKYQEIMGVAND